MSKVITSPVKKWPGTVTLCDPLSLPQALAVRESYKASLELAGGAEDIENVDLVAFHNELAPALLDCVKSWELEGLDNPPSPFPGTPRKSSAELMIWLTNEVTALFSEDEESEAKKN